MDGLDVVFRYGPLVLILMLCRKSLNLLFTMKMSTPVPPILWLPQMLKVEALALGDEHLKVSNKFCDWFVMCWLCDCGRTICALHFFVCGVFTVLFLLLATCKLGL